MDASSLLDQLESLAHSLGLQIRYERMDDEEGFSSGGLCRLRDKQYIIVNRAAPVEEKNRTLIRVLRRFDLSCVYMKPALRVLLEGLDE